LTKKVYRVDWKYSDEEFGEGSDYAFISAESEVAAMEGLEGTDFMARLATREEAEAYVAGFDDGFDMGTVEERMKHFDGKVVEMNSLDENGNIPDIDNISWTEKFICGKCNSQHSMDQDSGETIVIGLYGTTWAVCLECAAVSK
jgi:hypothetical protein